MKPSASQRTAGLSILLLLGIFLTGTTGFDPFHEIGMFNGKRILEVSLFLLLMSVTLLNPYLRDSFAQVLAIVPRWIVFALVVAGLLGTISALRFEHPGYGLLDVAMLTLLVLGILATASARRISEDGFDRIALLIVIAIGLIAVVTELMGFLAAWMMGFEFSFNKMLVRFFHPRFYNHLQTFSIPLIAALPFVFGPSRKLKAVAVTLIGLQWFLLLVSGGRGSVVSLTAAFTLVALLIPSNRRAWLSIQFAGLVLGVVIFFGAMQVNQLVSSDGRQFVSQSIGRPMAHTSGRSHMWQISWHQVLAEPMLGTGPSRFSCDLSPKTVAHAHSFPVTIMAEWGFPAFILIMLVCIRLGWGLIFKCRKLQTGDARTDILIAMLGCSIIAGTIHALVSGVLIMPASQVMAVLICGWALGRLSVSKTLKPTGNKAAVLILATALVTAALVSNFSFGELKKMDLRTRQQSTQILMAPRYWQSGHSCSYFYENH